MRFRKLKLSRAITLLATLLVLKVVAGTLISYRDYFPPNFAADFLHGREDHFFGSYQWAFYIHIIAGPVALLLGLLLMSAKLRKRWPRWHRRMGRAQGMNVLLLVAPSGLWMSGWAQAGPIAGAGLALLAVATATCVSLGWRAAVKRQFTEHRIWMYRTFLLLCSAVVIRMIGGLATVAGFYAPWVDPAAAWVSWLGPLLVYEVWLRTSMRQSIRWRDVAAAT